jgi:hypothetical protein
MKKRIVGLTLLAAALGGGPALAVQNVANTSQKGSLLIFPLIDVDPADSSNTLIEISNDQNAQVQLECNYVNEKKGRVDFGVHLSAKGTASWEVLTGIGENDTGVFHAPLFPSDGTFRGNSAKGELVCFAVDVSFQNQIAWNHLTGTATVVNLADPDANQKKQAFRYNPWAFAARTTAGPPAPDGTVQGKAGDLELTGGGDGTYDACPAYNIATFMPNGAKLNGVTTLDNDLSVVSCNQDLRQDFTLHLTKLRFTVWNAKETPFSGSWECVDSVTSVAFGPSDRSTGLVKGSNFDFSVLGTANARFQVKGVASTQCLPEVTESAGLLGVLTSAVALGTDTSEDQEIGSTTQGAGAQSGFVFWDPAGTVPLKHK